MTIERKIYHDPELPLSAQALHQKRVAEWRGAGMGKRDFCEDSACSGLCIVKRKDGKWFCQSHYYARITR